MSAGDTPGRKQNELETLVGPPKTPVPNPTPPCTEGYAPSVAATNCLTLSTVASWAKSTRWRPWQETKTCILRGTPSAQAHQYKRASPIRHRGTSPCSSIERHIHRARCRPPAEQHKKKEQESLRHDVFVKTPKTNIKRASRVHILEISLYKLSKMVISLVKRTLSQPIGNHTENGEQSFAILARA